MPDLLATARARSAAHARGLPFVEIGRVALAAGAVRSVPLEVLQRLQAVPYAVVDGALHVAFADPSESACAELAAAARRPVAAALASAAEVASVLHELERGGTLVNDELRLGDELTAVAPAVRTVNDVLRRAVAARASDIHLIPDHGYIHVRQRVDGVVEELELLPPDDASAVVARVKVLASANLAEHRRPQDGRFAIRTAAGRTIDVRVAVVPTVSGEGAVLRLLEKDGAPPSLTELGLSNAMQMELERIVHNAVGALLVTGPTGSGKSTTLYAALSDIARPERTVITIEDPVEYELPGTYQVQLSAAADVTFANALRSVLRSDPDVIMVGEIRDAETAEVALNASLAGHFVLSTLHTNDAPGAVTRLLEMGVQPYVVCAGLAGVIGQRLVRRLCLYCREPYTPSPALVEELYGDNPPLAPVFFRARGCPECAAGYRGRVAVFQLLPVDGELREVIASGAPAAALAAAAAGAGMRPLRDDALAKVEAGITSVEELYRAVP